eukprot:6185558-Pleurochrysis_carterae.AAC.1
MVQILSLFHSVLVEEVFGRWKNRFRFLLRPSHARHKLTEWAIYASMILRKCFYFYKDDGIPLQISTSSAWQVFFAKYQAELCPSCKRRGAAHCLHQAAINRNGQKLQKRLSGLPSAVRDVLCAELWRQLEVNTDELFAADTGLAEADGVNLTLMQARAQLHREGMRSSDVFG